MSPARPPFHLIAGPPPANPPLFLAILILAVSLTGPFLFTRAGAPSLLLAIAAAALGAAGLLALLSAIRAQRQRRADSALRCRASITADGIIFHPTRHRPTTDFFAKPDIEAVQLFPRALVVITAKTHAKPGRHRLTFGDLAIPRADLAAAIAALSLPGTKSPPE